VGCQPCRGWKKAELHQTVGRKQVMGKRMQKFGCPNNLSPVCLEVGSGHEQRLLTWGGSSFWVLGCYRLEGKDFANVLTVVEGKGSRETVGMGSISSLCLGLGGHWRCAFQKEVDLFLTFSNNRFELHTTSTPEARYCRDCQKKEKKWKVKR
jgi:hypothetical protein